jgi:hypothetical protein
LDEFFSVRVRQRVLYEEFVKFVERVGKFTINVNKTRISFQGRVRFAGVSRVTEEGIVVGFWLKRKIDSPRFSHIEFIPPNNWVYQLKITNKKDLDNEVLEWVKEAFKVGQQRST